MEINKWKYDFCNSENVLTIRNIISTKRMFQYSFVKQH